MNVIDLIKMKVKAYRLSTFYMSPDNNIVYITYQKKLSIDLKMAKALVAERLEFTENKKHYLIMRCSNIQLVTLTHEAKRYLQDPNGGLKNILGAAFIATNPAIALVASVFVKTPKKFPAKFFIKEKDAITWINKLTEYNKPSNLN